MTIRRVLTAGLAATALVLAGCSSSDDTAATTTDAPASSQVEATSEPETSETETSMDGASTGSSEDATDSSEATTSGQETEETSAATGSGDIVAFAEALAAANASVTSVKGSMTATLGSGGEALSAEYASTLEGGVATGLQMTNTIGGPQPTTMEILLVDGTYYLGGDQILQQLGVSGGSWVQLDPNSTNPAIAQMAAQMQTQAQTQGAGQVGELVKVAQSVEEIGAEDLAGVPTTHYRLTVDAAEAARLGGASGAESQEAGAALGGEIPMDLWVDENGRTVQLVMELDVQGETLTMTIKLYDYDVPVEITAPPADQIAQVPAG